MKPSQDDIVEAINHGLRIAERSYREASGVPIWEGPEYLTTVCIFQSISNLAKHVCSSRNCLTLELRPKTVEEYIPKKLARKPKSDDERRNGRCDLILWVVDRAKTRAIIEVKKYPKDCREDINRVIGLLGKGLEFGVLASHLSVQIRDDARSARKQTRKKLDEISQEIIELVNSKRKYDVELVQGNITRLPDFDGDYPGEKRKYYYCPICFMVRQKKN